MKPTHEVLWVSKDGYCYRVAGAFLDTQALFEVLKQSKLVKEVKVRSKKA